MAYDNLTVETEDGVVLVTINRPKALNALNTPTLLELEAVLATFRNPATVRALIITGAGEKAFVAGADIAEMAGYGPAQARAFAALGHRVLAALEALPVATIAAVNGFALGGGMELCMACDMIFAAENAVFGQPEVNLGLIPGFGGTQRLSRLVGKAHAKRLIFTGDRIDARTALSIGLVVEVVPREELVGRVKAVARSIAGKAPLAIAEAKRVIEAGYDQPLAAANVLEAQTFGLLFETWDTKEGLKAFLEKRPAQFRGA